MMTNSGLAKECALIVATPSTIGKIIFAQSGHTCVLNSLHYMSVHTICCTILSIVGIFALHFHSGKHNPKYAHRCTRQIFIFVYSGGDCIRGAVNLSISRCAAFHQRIVNTSNCSKSPQNLLQTLPANILQMMCHPMCRVPYLGPLTSPSLKVDI